MTQAAAVPSEMGSRELILEAARTELAANGYESATLRSIARRAGVDARLIRHYFRGKPDLVRQALGFDALVAQARRGLRVSALPAHTTRHLYRLSVRFWRAEPLLWQALVASSMSADPEVSTAFGALIDQLVEGLLDEPSDDETGARLRAELALGGLVGLWLTREVLDPEHRPDWAELEAPAVVGLTRVLFGSSPEPSGSASQGE